MNGERSMRRRALMLVWLTVACGSEKPASTRMTVAARTTLVARALGCYRLFPDSSVSPADVAVLQARLGTMRLLPDSQTSEGVQLRRVAGLPRGSTYGTSGMPLVLWSIDSATDTVVIGSNDFFTSVTLHVAPVGTSWIGRSSRTRDAGPPFGKEAGRVELRRMPCADTLEVHAPAF